MMNKLHYLIELHCVILFYKNIGQKPNDENIEAAIEE